MRVFAALQESGNGRYCCKSRKIPGGDFFERNEANLCSPINMVPRPLAKLPVSLSRGDEVPHVFIRESHQQPRKNLISGGKSIFQQHRSKPEITAAHHWHPLHPDQQTLRAQNGGCTATLILWRTLLEMGTKLIFVCQEPKQTRAGCIQRPLDQIPRFSIFNLIGNGEGVLEVPDDLAPLAGQIHAISSRTRGLCMAPSHQV